MKKLSAALLVVLLSALPACSCGCGADEREEPHKLAAQPEPRKFAEVAITNPRSLAIDAGGNLYVGDASEGKVYKIGPNGSAIAIGKGVAAFSDPLGVGVARDGAVYVANGSAGGVFRVTPGGGAADISRGTGADLVVTPTGVAVDRAGNAFIANNGGNNILKITPGGVVSVFAGKAGAGGAVDGRGADASFTTPRGIAIDGQDNLYVADEGNSNIRKITPAGLVTTLAGGSGEGGHKDGTGAEARFGAPRSLAAAEDGTIYVADTDNHVIRKITPSGVVTTLAGKPGEVGNANGIRDAARFSEPRGIAVDSQGNVFVADTGNGCIRQITPQGAVTTIAAAAPASQPASVVPQ
jgi:sugar lactone lactonase YvrE